MSDNRRRYLAQQAELGGNEIYVEQRGLRTQDVGPSNGDEEIGLRETEAGFEPTKSEKKGPRTKDLGLSSVDERIGSGETEAGAAPTKSQVPSPKSSRLRDWRKGAPAIPGPGLTVELPPPSLVGDEISQLSTLEAVAELISGCQKCALAQGRKHTVPGEGNPRAGLMLVGEGPGAKEDETGRPFVGAAGELLNTILASIGLAREAVYIANIVKCRPPQNRKPLPDEAAACLPYLRRQIELVRPKVLLALGGTAAEALLGVKRSLGQLREQVHRFGGIPLIVTYHPAALLRNPNWKKPTWDDVRIARQLLDR